MKCDNIQDLLSPYIDEMTGAKETEAIKLHLDGCTRCQADYAALLSLRQTLLELPVPAAPERFMTDFASRLSQEQNRLVDFQRDRTHTLRRPSWVGWVSASAAAVALTVGIYMSSYLPSALQVAHNEQPATSSLTVDEIISSLELNPVETPEIAENFNPFVPDNLGPEYYPETPNYTVADNSDSAEPEPEAPIESAAVDSAAIDTAQPGDEIMTMAAAEDYVVQHYYSSNQVASIEDSMRQIEVLARAQGIEYNVASAESSSLMTVATANENQSIILQVPPDQLDKVLNDLAGQGIEAPVMNEVDYNDQYGDIDKELTKVDESITALEQNPQLTQDQQEELKVLQNNQEILENQQKLIESQAGQVQVEVNFNTSVNP